MAVHHFDCIDAHTCGNPVRVVRVGGPELEGNTMIERRAHFLRDFDWIRCGLMFEPRGHDIMSGSILYPSNRDDCDIGVLYIETSGCLPMCGHGTIGTVTVMIQEGLVTPATPGVVRLETPAGRVDAFYTMDGDRVASVRLVNIPSFLYVEGLEVECPDLGKIKVDVGYGGNFYAIVDPQENYRDLADYTAGDLIRWSPILRHRINEAYDFVHPEDDRIRGMSHLLWTGAPRVEGSHARNAVFLWHESHRPIPMRYGYEQPDGAMGSIRKVEEGRRIRPREYHRKPVRGQGRRHHKSGCFRRDYPQY